MSLYYSEFKNCCGIKIISGFGNGPNMPVYNSDNLPTIKQELKELVLNNALHVSCTLIALNSEQTGHFEAMLAEFDYVAVVRDMFHPGHGSYITLFARVSHPTKL